MTFAAAIGLLLAACGSDVAVDDGTDDQAAEPDESVEADDGAAGDIEPLSFMLGDIWPPDHDHVTHGTDVFVERLEHHADGRFEVEVDYFGNSELAGAAEALDAVRDGVLQIGAISGPATASEIPPIGVTEIGGLLDSSEIATYGLFRFLTEVIQDDFLDLGVRPMFLLGTGPYQIASVDPVRSLDDAAGLALRTGGGGTSEVAEAIGATPVEMTAADQYIALERGTLDGSMLAISSFIPNNVHEVTNYVTRNLSLGNASGVWVANEEWWQTLAPEHQEAIQAAASDVLGVIGPHLDEVAEVHEQMLVDEGLEVVDVSDLDGWSDALADHEEVWAARMDAQGYDGAALVEAWKDILRDLGVDVDD